MVAGTFYTAGMQTISRAPFVRDAEASTVALPPGDWHTVFEALCARFPMIEPAQWRQRIARRRVLDGNGEPITLTTTYRAGLRIHYYREVPNEVPIPFAEAVVHQDEHLVVADKPHFLPVTPTGRFVEQTLLRRLQRRLDNPHLVPLHRIDRATAGLVLLSASPASRSAYQALFRERRIDKTYEALAPALPATAFPCIRRSRLVRGEPFFLTREIEGEANSETRVEVLERGAGTWRYALFPLTGKKHQLRVHMAALGAPIVGETLYPQLQPASPDEYAQPLKLLARRLAFADPLTDQPRSFESRLALA